MTDPDELRDRIVAAVPHEGWCHLDGCSTGYPCGCQDVREATADAVLPVVRATIAAELDAAVPNEVRDEQRAVEHAARLLDALGVPADAGEDVIVTAVRALRGYAAEVNAARAGRWRA